MFAAAAGDQAGRRHAPRLQVTHDRERSFARQLPIVLPFAFLDGVGVGVPEDVDVFAREVRLNLRRDAAHDALTVFSQRHLS